MFVERRKWEVAIVLDPSLISVCCEGGYNLATRLIWASWDYTKPKNFEDDKKASTATFNKAHGEGLFKLDPSLAGKDKKNLPKALRDLL